MFLPIASYFLNFQVICQSENIVIEFYFSQPPFKHSSLVHSQILVTRSNSTTETSEQMCEICSKLTIKTLKRQCRSGLYHSM